MGVELFHPMEKQKMDKQKRLNSNSNLIKIVPYKVYTILPHKGIQLTNRAVDKHAWMPIFVACTSYDHRLTHENHPRINGQIERMKPTFKEITAFECILKT